MLFDHRVASSFIHCSATRARSLAKQVCTGDMKIKRRALSSWFTLWYLFWPSAIHKTKETWNQYLQWLSVRWVPKNFRCWNEEVALHGSCPQRCLLRLFQVYLRHRPTECDDTFYLTPLWKPKGTVWYSKVPVGHNTLSKTVGRLCKKADISGYKTNQSQHTVATSNTCTTTGSTCTYNFNFTGCSSITINNLKAPN